ncbi:unnamed protein product, partial [Ixodes persulcatus]
FRVADFSDILDWRPILFQEPIVAHRACVLCGVVYRKAVRLPCLHTLCIKCHALCVVKGGECPVDQQPFCEDDVERLEAFLNYILKRKVACWNAPSGCSFVGPAASLLDHHKECDFNVVPCCLCHSSVLQSNILEHFKSDCSIRQATGEPTNTPATQDLEDVSRACLEMKKAIGKISEDLMSLQTSLNQCREDVRRRLKQSRQCMHAEPTPPRGEGQNTPPVTSRQQADVRRCVAFTCKGQVLQAAIAGYKDHVTKELRLLGCCKPVRIHWYIEGWADLKKKALEVGLQSLDSPTKAVYDYSVSQVFQLNLKEGKDRVGCFMKICPGKQDLQLEWPFRKVYTVGVIHPKDQSKEISYMVNPGNCKDDQQHCFLRPKEKANVAYGTQDLTAAETLETGGFIESNTLHVFLEVEP